MYKLIHDQAQKIVDKMMKDIPYNINIMVKTGIIIGSGNKERIGTLHHGAVATIKQKKIVEIRKDEEFVKKGINLPIELNGDKNILKTCIQMLSFLLVRQMIIFQTDLYRPNQPCAY